ncbi:hypothetical protein ABNIH4_09279, partial [Acinetobacter baumannii ABNIH4]
NAKKYQKTNLQLIQLPIFKKFYQSFFYLLYFYDHFQKIYSHGTI